VKLFLYSSFQISPENSAALNRLVGKDPKEITIAAIENATDIIDDAKDWVADSRNSLITHGGQVEVVDLRNWQKNPAGLREKLASKDVIWLCGGHTFYLRWMLKKTGADSIIKELVQQGKVYAGWSAGAVVAGPTLRLFDRFDDPKDAPEAVWDGLGLTNIVTVIHMDNPAFADEMKKINQELLQAGFTTAPLNEAQALMIDGDEQKVI
jgi:dipeptidase E